MKPDVDARALRAGVPALADRHAPLELATLPTPIDGFPRLAEAWGLASLHVKRDDATSDLYGGTKVRSLEWLLGAAKQRGARCVLTTGPWGSHHARATATFAPRAGLACRLVLFPQAPGDEVEAARRDLPALCSSRFTGWLGFPLAWCGARWKGGETGRPVVIPAGATSAVGILGSVEAGLELMHAVHAGALPEPDDVLVAAGSCGTAAGLLLGLGLAGFRGRVVAVRVTPRVVARPGRVRKLAAAAARLIVEARGPRVADLPDLVWVDDLIGRGYGFATADGAEVTDAVAPLGLELERTYTAKTLSHAWLRRLSGRRVVFWNTYAGVGDR